MNLTHMSKRTWTLIRLLIAAGIIAFIVTKVNVRDVVVSILSAKPDYVIAALALTLTSWTLSSYRLKYFSALQGLAISTFQALEINLSTIFYGLFLPGGNLTGGLIKFYKLSSKDRKISGAFIALGLERVFATIALCLVGLYFWIVSIPKDAHVMVIGMIAILAGLAGFCAMIFLDSEHRFINLVLSLVNRIYRSPKLNRFVQNLAWRAKITLSDFILMLSLSLLTQVLNVIVFYTLLRSVELDISLVTIGWIRSVVVLVTMIPVSISGMGLREGSFILLLGTYGVNESSAFAYSLLVFAVTRIVPGLIGGLFESRNLLFGSTS